MTSTDHDLQVQSIAHGVIALEQVNPDYGIERRRLRVVKYRGSTHGTNEYPFLIDERGISVLPISSLGLDHPLILFGSTPEFMYSAMNGYGHFLKGWSWYALYWSLFTVSALILAQAFWVRGLARPWRARLRLAGARLKGGAGVAAAIEPCAYGAPSAGAGAPG